jgi:segregation and condensation protein B
MSLKAKLEAVIYAAEEPVTLTQLALLFAGDALEWKAAQQAAAAEQAAEIAGENHAVPSPPLVEGLEYLGLENAPAYDAGADPEAESADEPPAEPPQPVSEAEPPTPEVEPPATEIPSEQASAALIDAEAEAKRQARLRDREIKGVLKNLLDELVADYTSDGRGVEIREIAGGYRMATKPECHDAVRLFVKSLKPPMKLSLPALETLAVVAYKQPVTSPEVSEIRGVESGGVLGSLLARKLIATAGRKQVIGRPILYKTTKEFLLRFGLRDLAELPSMEEFEKMAAAEIEELEPEVVAADAAQSAVDLVQNSSSGEEMAEAAEELESSVDESQSPQSPVLEGEASAQESVEADSESATSNQPESAADTSAEPEAAPNSLAGHHLAPAQPHEENEAVVHAQKDEEER